MGNGAIAIGNAGGVISLLSNTGTISAGRSNPTLPYAIDNSNDGLITTLNNSGTISTGAGGVGINNSATITSLDNSGSASAGDNGSAIRNTGTISTLNNSGTISVTDNGTGAAYSVNYGILNTGSITTLSNQGNITVTASGLGSSAVGIRAAFGGTVTSFLNSGAIRATTTNTDGVAYGIRIWDGGTFSTITNTGSITAVSSGVNGLAYGIASVNVLTTLNNAQGGNASSPATTALTYRGVLPTNYNIIINSASYYGQLAVSSPIGTITNFGIYGAPFITLRTYGSVLSGTALPSGTRSGTYDNMTWSLVENGSAIDLVFTGASLMGTQQSLVNTASVLQGTFTLQNSVMVNGFTYDCSLFDRRGICVSAGGRNTTVQAQGINNTSGLLIASYRLNKNNSRIGAWVDQNLSVNGPGTVKLGNSTPMIGLFGVWSQRPDGVGAEVKVSAAYGQKDTTITRQIVGLSEAGSGSSKLISQGAQVVAKYGFAVLPDVVVSPYAGVRYTQNNMGGYTEATSSAVTTPLTYSALNTNATTALAGAEARYRGIPKTTLFASAGVETDTNTSNGSYSATGITGLTPVNFNPNPVKTRPTATVGGYYDILKNQRIGITGIYRQEPFQAVSTTTVLATYTIGL
ncbi:hypothetical protein PHIN9_17700 [Polynucleobacter sp. HIN9]|nr:hypothetical protein PHIN9_17700 [Polynucleobacter sp. HIN9]